METKIAQLIRSNPVSNFLDFIAIPLGKEYPYRLIPGSMLNANDGLRLDVGIPLAALFALSHNIIIDAPIPTRHVIPDMLK
mgnify:CR=1 FL=1